MIDVRHCSLSSEPAGLHRGELAGWLFAVLAAVCGAGCGLGMTDDQSGGDDHLPTQGAGPYGKLERDIDTPVDEPYVVTVAGASVRDPSVLRRSDGGFRLWFGYEEILHGPAGGIWAAELTQLTDGPDVAPHPVLTADAAWEDGWIGAPCVIELSSGELVMFYQGGLSAPGIGRAESRDGGASWQKYPGNPVIRGLAEPAAAVLPDGTWVLYATHSEMADIVRADSPDGLRFVVREEAVLRPRAGELHAFDRYALSDPWVLVRRTPAGRLHYALFFNGSDRAGAEAVVSIGWAGSFDGLHFTRFAGPDQPVLAAGGTSEHGPAVILESDRGILFFSEQRRGAESIAAAVHP